MPDQLPPVSIEEFEGPFDLLIELAAQSKVDLSMVSLARVTDAYIASIQQAQFAPSLVADFLVVAATLLLLKVKQLLPELEPGEEIAIAQLSDRVRIYQLYREQAQRILSRWRPWLLPSPALLRVTESLPFPQITRDDLAQTMTAVIKQVTLPRPSTRHLRRRGRTLQECLTLLQERLATRRKVVLQDEMPDESRDTLAVSFLAVLELARQHKVALHQSELFAPLTVVANH